MKLSEHKTTLIFTSIVTLFPILIGLLLWNQLPEQLATHFNSKGQPDDYSSKFFAVVGLPILMLVIQWLLIASVHVDPRRKNISPKIFSVVTWLVPIASLILCSSTYFYGLGMDISFENLGLMISGLVFIVAGNFLPKCPRNYTIGFRLSWTLEDEENWNKTHRMGGYLWILLGLAQIAGCFLGLYWILHVVLATGVLVPIIYSYSIYAKKKNNV